MSNQTLEWLNTMTLQGYTAERGTAWHYLASAQGVEPNHYPGAIPVADVKRRLFYWDAVEGKLKTTVRVGGKSRTVPVTTHKTFVHPETLEVLGVVGKRHAIHGYGQWLIDNTRETFDTDELGIGSAGLLKGGAVAWVQIELAKTIDGPGGVAHRPFYTATTVLDGSMSTTYQVGTRLVVCDNTLAGALAEGKADRMKYPHKAGTRFSPLDTRDRLGILFENGASINAELDQLLNTPVSDPQWESFVVAHIGSERPADEGRGQTNWDNTHDGLTAMYKSDPRCKAWTGTAFGALQAVSTHSQHERTVKGMSRPERNMLNMATGRWGKEDASAISKLQAVLAA